MEDGVKKQPYGDWKRIAVRIPITAVLSEPSTGPWLNEATFNRALPLWKALTSPKRVV